MASGEHEDSYSITTLAESLVGQTLRGVRYFDTPCFGDSIPEWPSDGPHGVGHGVDLLLDDGCVAVTWGKQFTSWNLTALPFSLVDFLLAGRFEMVNEKAPWLSLIGSEITGVEVHWLTENRGGTESIRFPFAVELDLADDAFVVLAAASYHEPNAPAFPGGDDIVVAWTLGHVRAVLPDLVEPLQRKHSAQ